MTSRRVPFNGGEYEQRVIGGRCFVCAMLAGDPEYRHHIVHSDGDYIAFLSRYPTTPGYVLACPRRHVSHVFRDLTRADYDAMMRFVRLVGRGLEVAVSSARTYVASLGSQEGNSHLHWHLVPCPPGTPYEEQQFSLMMTSRGVLEIPDAEQAALAARIGAAIRALPREA